MRGVREEGRSRGVRFEMDRVVKAGGKSAKTVTKSSCMQSRMYVRTYTYARAHVYARTHILTCADAYVSYYYHYYHYHYYYIIYTVTGYHRHVANRIVGAR